MLALSNLFSHKAQCLLNTMLRGLDCLHQLLRATPGAQIGRECLVCVWLGTCAQFVLHRWNTSPGQALRQKRIRCCCPRGRSLPLTLKGTTVGHPTLWACSVGEEGVRALCKKWPHIVGIRWYCSSDYARATIVYKHSLVSVHAC